jgi:hypothetical protein
MAANDYNSTGHPEMHMTPTRTSHGARDARRRPGRLLADEKYARAAVIAFLIVGCTLLIITWFVFVAQIQSGS